MARIISTSKQYVKDLFNELDSTNYFQLGNSSTKRHELFTFALGLGQRESVPKDINVRADATRIEYLENLYYLYSSVFFHDVISENTEEIDKIVDEDAMIALVEKYANAGFEKIEEYMAHDYRNDDELMWKLLADMEDVYDEFLEDCKED